ncbi:MAG TPA: GNAT family N-acetyltransferase [Bacteroidia bacterium]|nr:GNAT family N-acetyltransferase [Bacteroidia bacterium]
MPIISTSRLELLEICETDAPFILELFNTPSWLKYIGDRNLRTEEDAKSYIINRLIPGYKLWGFGFYLTRLKENNVPIGICGIVKRDFLEHVDIGFAFLPQYEGKGFGYESASAVMHYAQTTLGIKAIAGITNSNNKSSIALLEKLGLKFSKMILLPSETEEIMLFVNQ